MRVLIVCLTAALCSGCATVSHFDSDASDRAKLSSSSPSSLRSDGRHEEAPTAQPETELNVRASMPPCDSSKLDAESADSRPLERSTFALWNWHFDASPRPALMDLTANTQFTLVSDSSTVEISNTSPPELNPFSRAYVGLVWDNIKATFTAPAQWDTRDWLVAGGVAAGIGTVAAFDEDIQRAIQRNRNGTLDDIFSNVQGFGSEYVPGVIGAFYLGGMVFDDPQAKSVALDATSASIIASGLILYPLKYTVGRARPGSNEGAYHFAPFSGSDSFPSGHTTEAFTLATVISEHYHSIWIDLGCYGIASAVGYARLEQNYHWASDVLAGAAIGTFVGHLVVHVNHNRWGLAFQPILGRDMNGAQLSWSF